MKNWAFLLTLFLCGFLVIGDPGIVSADRVKVLTTGDQPGHYLEWNGESILLIGDSVTQGWMETGTNFNQNAYVDALASRGMNLLMLWAYIGTNASGQTSDSRIGYDAPEIWPWQGSPDQKNFDLTKFNQAYFDRLKSLVAYAEGKGIVVLITIHDGWIKDRFDRHPFNGVLGNGPLSDNSQYVDLADYYSEMPSTYNPSWSRQQKNQHFQERLCDKLISELSPYSNVIYEMFNEGYWYDITKRRNHEQHFLAFFRARSNNLLLTNTDHITGDDPHNDAKVDVVTLHGDWTNRFNDFQSGFNTNPAKPYLLSEPVPGWRGDFSTDTIRRSVWEVAMAGAGWVNQNDPSFGWDTQTNIASKASLRDQAYDYAGHAARFFNDHGVEFWNMKPNGNRCSTNICLVNDGKEYAVYSPSGGSFTVDLSAGSGKTFNVKWYNPRTGDFQTGSDVAGGSSSTSFIPPFSGDAVLHLKYSVQFCGNGNCDSGECDTCPSECTLAQCCGIEGCNSPVGETCLTCESDCGPCPTSDICNGLALLMHFDNQAEYGETPTHIYDFSGNGNDGSCSGSFCPTWSSSGKFSGAFDFDGIQNYINVGDPADGSLDFGTSEDFTLSVWIKPEGNDSRFLSKGGYSNTIAGYVLMVKNTDAVEFEISNGSGRPISDSGGSLVVDGSTWYHIVAIVDRDVGYNVYINGADTFLATVDTSLDNIDSVRDLNIGRRDDGDDHFNGKIDDMAIWNRALSSQEIQDIYNSGAPITCATSTCSSGVDTNSDGVVSMTELMSYIADWKVGSVQMTELMTAIGEWKNGC